jgi:hypothetical protein
MTELKSAVTKDLLVDLQKLARGWHVHLSQPSAIPTAVGLEAEDRLAVFTETQRGNAEAERDQVMQLLVGRVDPPKRVLNLSLPSVDCAKSLCPFEPV